MVAQSWKYYLGLLLIGAVVLIWVTSAEITQAIYVTYPHPFLLTWLGSSLLFIFLPLAYGKDALRSFMTSKLSSPRPKYQRLMLPSISPRSVSLDIAFMRDMHRMGSKHDSDEIYESDILLEKPHSQLVKLPPTVKELLKIAIFLAPLWLMTEYLSNLSLSMTSVSSATLMNSTSSLFTLLFGSAFGEDKLSIPKIIAVFVSIAGVVMTEMSKAGSTLVEAGSIWRGNSGSDSNSGQTVTGDLISLASAASYGFYTIMLRKYASADEGSDHGPDMQKLFGFIGLVTFLGLWWIAAPLMYFGVEPAIKLPRSYGMDEEIIANALVGSVISDYFWALSVVWTTPLVATLGLSLTIPLAMVADIVMHGSHYSFVYILGAAQVFLGFLVANLADNWTQQKL